MATLKSPLSPADHLQGDPHAPVALVEYGDYQCPHCGHAYPIVKRVQQHFGKRLAFAFRNFPLNQAHPAAEHAAEAAEFAGAHGKFWEMHDAIFENQSALDDDLLLTLAENLGLRPTDLAATWDAETYTPKVKSDFTGGARSGVNGTPTFFINGHRHDAPFEFEDLVHAITAALSHANPSNHSS